MASIGIVFGTRPEAIKLAPVVKAFQDSSWETRIIVTGQHREMLDQVLDIFRIVPDYDLDVMSPGQSLSDITNAVLRGMDQILSQTPLDYLLVHGDTTSALAAALAGYYHRIPVGHVEAGLRTGNMYHPFPEELNRKLVDHISSLLFAPTEKAAENLRREGFPDDRIFVTGNTVVDALRMVVKPKYQFRNPLLSRLTFQRPVVVVTAHRRENWGGPMADICKATAQAAAELPLDFVFSMHKNPELQAVVKQHLGGFANVHLIEAISYDDFINLLNRCYFIVTDSGGLQEEGAALGKPVLVMREFTERPEALEAGFVRLVGTDQDRIRAAIVELANDQTRYTEMADGENPYGDGRAAARIRQIMTEYDKQKPE